jgi:transposase
MHELVSANEATNFVKQIHLIESYKGAGFLSAISLMGEIEEYSVFRTPKQLFAYFGLNSTVKQSGKFEGTKISMSKRGSRIARRVLHTMPLISISKNRNGCAWRRHA